MKRLVLVLVFTLGLAGVSFGQGRDRGSRAERAARAEAREAASRALDARTQERAAWDRVDRNPADGRAEKDAQRASDRARETGKAAHEAGVKLDRIERANRGIH
jgi:uncharacterized protein HemX